MQQHVNRQSIVNRFSLPWAALAFLLAYTFDLRLLLAAGILCLIAFIAARTPRIVQMKRM
jgi:hypothetical protein